MPGEKLAEEPAKISLNMQPPSSSLNIYASQSCTENVVRACRGQGLAPRARRGLAMPRVNPASRGRRLMGSRHGEQPESPRARAKSRLIWSAAR